MVEPITAPCLGLLRLMAKHGSVTRNQILGAGGSSETDLTYLLKHALVDEREPGVYRVSHLGQRLLKMA